MMSWSIFVAWIKVGKGEPLVMCDKLPPFPELPWLDPKCSVKGLVGFVWVLLFKMIELSQTGFKCQTSRFFLKFKAVV